MCFNRKELKELYKLLDDTRSDIQSSTVKYINSLADDEHGIYISDHAIVRYLERIKGIVFPNAKLTDAEKLAQYTGLGYIGNIRKEMLTIGEDRKILHGQKTFFKRDTYAYIIKELTVVTVLNLS